MFLTWKLSIQGLTTRVSLYSADWPGTLYVSQDHLEWQIDTYRVCLPNSGIQLEPLCPVQHTLYSVSFLKNTDSKVFQKAVQVIQPLLTCKFLPTQNVAQIMAWSGSSFKMQNFHLIPGDLLSQNHQFTLKITTTKQSPWEKSMTNYVRKTMVYKGLRDIRAYLVLKATRKMWWWVGCYLFVWL